ncbi:hypothetical protein JR316_0003999 [Psilocybe cubensis]|uniref:Uncharacterized protein n=2 Tax=Psilocybe cubensis TaxID=181762 RepID=A0ACB8HA22_PSICU|nr:hypothetical protein JR316_0003999 [Psilocybe cubensis]KAH9484517.1 hypothetical protein JR316_0003999 [Psilocybe cubensis]
MSATTSTSCHISPHSFAVIPISTHSIPIPNPFSNPHSNQSPVEPSKATRTYPARQKFSRSLSFSTVTTIQNSRPPLMHAFGANALASNTSFDVYGGDQNSSFLEFDAFAADHSSHFQYLRDVPTEAGLKSGSITTPLVQTNSPTRVRQRARSTRQRVQEVTSTSGTRSIAKGSRAVDGASERLKRTESGGDISGYHQGPRQENNKPANLRDAEAAAQRELEEDDYAWYYRNPHRYVWRPRNARKRMHRRRRIIHGVAAGEEGAPTNMSLFIAYLQSQQYSPTLIRPLLVSEARNKSTSVTEDEGPHSMALVDHDDEDASMLSMPDAQEDLFSPNECHFTDGPEHEYTSYSSSLESSDSSCVTISSAASSPQLGYDTRNDKNYNEMVYHWTRRV